MELTASLEAAEAEPGREFCNGAAPALHVAFSRPRCSAVAPSTVPPRPEPCAACAVLPGRRSREPPEIVTA